MRRIIPLFLILCFCSTIFAQNLFPGRGKVFEDDVVPRIDIIIPEDSLAELFAPGNEQSNYHCKPFGLCAAH